MNWEKDLIKYRREKAAETLEVARILLQGKTKDLLELSGTWEDDRPVEEIIKVIYDSRTSSQEEISYSFVKQLPLYLRHLSR